MKGKGLVPLLIIAVILVGLVIWKKTSAPTRTLKEQVDLVALLPEDVEPSTLGKLELYSGANVEDKVTLARGDGAWIVESHFGAPVAEDKIDDYIEALDELQGEFREEAASDTDLEGYDLTDEKAFHVVGYAKDATEPAFHLLVGKSPDYRTVFMRASDQKKVYVEDSNLRQLAGVYGEDTAAAPTASPWLDKKILELDQEKMTKVELKMPDKTLVFEKQTPEAPTESDAATAEEAPAPAPAAEPKWVLVAGGPGGDLKPAAVDNVVRKVATLSATDIVDPSKKAEWGLESPEFVATISRSEGDPVVIEGGRAEGATDGYVRVASSVEDRVYKLDSYSFGQLFPKGSTLFTLEGLALGTDAIDRIEVTQPEGDFAVAKSGDEWSVEAPAANLPVQKTTIDTMKSMLTSWKPDDYADAVDGTGLENPERSVTFTVGGETRTLQVGNKSRSSDGYYATLDSAATVFAMSKTDYQKVFVEPANLYQLKLVDATASDVQSVAIERADDAFTLEQADDTWSFAAGGPSGLTVDQEKASDLVNTLLALQAADIIYGERSAGTPVATVVVSTADDSTTLAVEAEQDGRYPVTLAERSQAVWVEKPELDNVLVASDSLIEAPQPAPAADAAAPATEAPGDAETAPAPETPSANESKTAPATVTIDPSALTAPTEPAPVEPAPAPESGAPAETPAPAPAAETPSPAETPAPAPAG